MSDVSVHNKEGNHLDEIMVSDLHCDYATLWHSGSNNATMIDMHLKMKEAKALYEALQEIFEVQTEDKAGDQSLHETTSPQT